VQKGPIKDGLAVTKKKKSAVVTKREQSHRVPSVRALSEEFARQRGGDSKRGAGLGGGVKKKENWVGARKMPVRLDMGQQKGGHGRGTIAG